MLLSQLLTSILSLGALATATAPEPGNYCSRIIGQYSPSRDARMIFRHCIEVKPNSDADLVTFIEEVEYQNADESWQRPTKHSNWWVNARKESGTVAFGRGKTTGYEDRKDIGTVFSPALSGSHRFNISLDIEIPESEKNVVNNEEFTFEIPAAKLEQEL